jgi:hypothetical protein
MLDPSEAQPDSVAEKRPARSWLASGTVARMSAPDAPLFLDPDGDLVHFRDVFEQDRHGIAIARDG